LFVAVADASDGLAHDLFLFLDDENDLAPDVRRAGVRLWRRPIAGGFPVRLA
jgi:hypothetical protein